MVDTPGQVGYIIKEFGMKNNMTEIKPGLYILDDVDPPKELVIEIMDNLIAEMPKYKKFLERVKRDLMRRYENDRD